ncbi:Protein of unknown function (DUF2975) [Nonlabens dokdonensis]|uniref:DUF2975 domain-containing protein n=2 Tax=Nonlabens dokdonensis TaxID=328515 RepID=L7WBV0_NONDD|nr:DUF2975 domain-containing protein [Nonlabens dokdonensis]AGC76333.1 hypothetical protein DDD_1206 [Nonlabens dokdonensis DSW-6]PZX43995.1 Protein of unknown function (DUF2975) [Nonlabens dokdonensis]
MKNKRYFDPLTISFTLLIIIGSTITILSRVSKQILIRYDLINTQNTTTNYSLLDLFIGKTNPTTPIIEIAPKAIFNILIIYSVICFYRFMVKSNKGLLFSNYSFRLWNQIKIIYILMSISAVILSLIGLEFLPYVIIYGFVGAIAHSFSKIFKESSIIKSENDLTI